MRNEYCLEAHNLHHAYGKRPEVLRGVDLALTKGSITALLGLNGAGKTTLLRSLLGLIRPQTGEIEVFGHRIGCKPLPPKILARIGYVPEHPFSDERMTAAQMLDLVRQVHPHLDPETVRRYLSIFNIPLTRKTKDLSAGTKAQLALTLAMAGRPDLLILDEPTQGLDPLHRHQYLQMLTAEASARELTILITSHDLYQIERMADTVCILHGGCIAEAAPLNELKARVKRIRVRHGGTRRNRRQGFACPAGCQKSSARSGRISHLDNQCREYQRGLKKPTRLDRHAGRGSQPGGDFSGLLRIAVQNLTITFTQVTKTFAWLAFHSNRLPADDIPVCPDGTAD